MAKSQRIEIPILASLATATREEIDTGRRSIAPAVLKAMEVDPDAHADVE